MSDRKTMRIFFIYLLALSCTTSLCAQTAMQIAVVADKGPRTDYAQALLEADLLNQGAKTLAYSYVGPQVTQAIYRNGTIGEAKKDLEQMAKTLSAELAEHCGGTAYVAVNKAVVTQASSAIPVVPLYVSILFKLMKEAGSHEGCIEQIVRLFGDRLQDLHRVPNVRVSGIERRKSEPQQVRWAKIGNDAATSHGFYDLQSMGVSQRHLAATLVWFSRCEHGKAVFLTAFVDPLHEKTGQLDRFFTHLGKIDLQQ